MFVSDKAKRRNAMTITDIIREFAKFGFVETPLTIAQMEDLIRHSLPMDEIYSVGCDVANGWNYYEALDLTLRYAAELDGIGEGQGL
jgi:hypothetical protein